MLAGRPSISFEGPSESICRDLVVLETSLCYKWLRPDRETLRILDALDARSLRRSSKSGFRLDGDGPQPKQQAFQKGAELACGFRFLLHLEVLEGLRFHIP